VQPFKAVAATKATSPSGEKIISRGRRAAGQIVGRTEGGKDKFRRLLTVEQLRRFLKLTKGIRRWLSESFGTCVDERSPRERFLPD